MLKTLDITNYALIEKLEVNFDRQLNIITGETGAGKSILLGALGLIMGKRADAKVVSNEDAKCIIEGTFDINNYQLEAFFEENDLDFEAELTIRRELTANGKSRAFINDSPVTLDILQQLTENLIELHQQFDTLDLHKPAFQLRIVDALAKNESLLAAYKKQYKAYTTLLQQIKSLEESSKNESQELDFLTFQLKELTEVKLVAHEEETLEQQLSVLTAAEEIKKVTGALAYQLEDGEQAINHQLTALSRELSNIAPVDKAYDSLYERLTSVLEELKDIAREASQINENTDYDAAAITQVQDRMNVIYRLFKKHKVENSEALLTIQSALVDRLGGFENKEERLEKWKKEADQLRQDLLQQAKVLSDRRQKIAKTFEADVQTLLMDLGMPNAKLHVQCTPLQEPNINGIDAVEYLFAANKGGALLPLKDVASGGEISRLTLSIKSIVANAMQMPTMIFDEIDMGVSGEVASKMAKILEKFAQNQQVINITHSPQIAAKADKHLFVFKIEAGQKTISAIKTLDHEARIIEIAKMLSGDPPSAAALENAKDLMQR